MSAEEYKMHGNDDDDDDAKGAKGENSTPPKDDDQRIYDQSFSSTPAGKFFNVFFDDTMRFFNYPLNKVAPNWTEQPIMRECNVGNTLGQVVNDGERFALEMDVSQFRPDELTVDLNENDRELLVEGNQQQTNCDDNDTTMKRHFQRSFPMPSDIRLDSIVSQLTQGGKLRISAPKQQQNNEPMIIRRIPIDFIAADSDTSNRQSSNTLSTELSSESSNQPTDTTTLPGNSYELNIFCIR